ncbi:MAG TPA: glutathione S-transferase [Kofleriaceae bacterium]
MITVHHLDHSRSQRVLWMLEELGVPYEIVKYQRDPKTMLAPPELEKIHPLGKSPVIVDGGATLAESGAILEYLVETYGNGKFRPADGQAHRDYQYWLHYAEGSLMPILLMKLIAGRIKAAPVPFFIKPVTKKIAGQIEGSYVAPNLTKHLAFVGAHLAKHDWFAGDFSAADVQMSFPMEASAARGGDACPASIKAWVEKIHARPAFKKALEKGGAYEILG